MTIEQFVPRERTEGDSYKPSENVGRAIIVRVNEHKHIDSTVHKPEGGPAVVCDVHDVAGNHTYRDVLWMNGAVVDELKGWLGRIVVIKFAWAQPSKPGGQAYISVQPADPFEMQQAQARMNQGDPFALTLQTTAAPLQNGVGATPTGNPQQYPGTSVATGTSYPWQQQNAGAQQQQQQQDPWAPQSVPGSQAPF